MGRVMCCGRGKATFILMHQSWCVGERSKYPVQKTKGRTLIKSVAASSNDVDIDVSDVPS